MPDSTMGISAANFLPMQSLSTSLSFSCSLVPVPIFALSAILPISWNAPTVPCHFPVLFSRYLLSTGSSPTTRASDLRFLNRASSAYCADSLTTPPLSARASNAAATRSLSCTKNTTSLTGCAASGRSKSAPRRIIALSRAVPFFLSAAALRIRGKIGKADSPRTPTEFSRRVVSAYEASSEA